MREHRLTRALSLFRVDQSAQPGAGIGNLAGRTILHIEHSAGRAFKLSASSIGELTEIHRHLAELGAVTEPRPTHTGAEDVRQARSSSDDARRLLRRLDVAVNVMREELDRLGEHQRDD